MIRLSINILSATLVFLKRVAEKEIYSYNDLLYLPSIMQINVNRLYEFSLTLKYVELFEDHIGLTDDGTVLARVYEKRLVEQCYRKMLRDYIIAYAPMWGYKIPSGRKEAYFFMSKDEQACFNEANLMASPPSEFTIKWWDKMSSYIRELDEDSKLEIGRNGEKLTIEYEVMRVGITPQWMSIDSNKLGYDIKSKVSKELDSQLLIEVKASTQPIDYAYFFLTVNEYEVAKRSENYLIYLWLINNSGTYLAKLKYDEVRRHIPSNNADGLWENVKIPFSSFRESFVRIKSRTS